MGIGIDVAGQLDFTAKGILVVFQILIVVLDGVLGLTGNVIKVDRDVLVHGRKIKAQAILIGHGIFLQLNPTAQAHCLVIRNTVVEQIRDLYGLLEGCALGDLRPVGLRHHGRVGFIHIVHGDGDGIPVRRFRDQGKPAQLGRRKERGKAEQQHNPLGKAAAQLHCLALQILQHFSFPPFSGFRPAGGLQGRGTVVRGLRGEGVHL